MPWHLHTTKITTRPPRADRKFKPPYDEVREIRESSEPVVKQGEKHGMSGVAIWRIKQRQTYKELP